MAETQLSDARKIDPMASEKRGRNPILLALAATGLATVATALGQPALGQSAADLAPANPALSPPALEPQPDLPAPVPLQPGPLQLEPPASQSPELPQLRLEPAVPESAVPEAAVSEPAVSEPAALEQPAQLRPEPALDAARSLPPSAPGLPNSTPLPPRYPSDASFLLPPRPIFAEPQSTELRLVLRLSDRRVYVYRGDEIERSYPVAVGKAGWETPVGSYEVMTMIEDPSWENPFTGDVIPAGPDNPLGDRWIGFWTDGNNFIGFHGTPNEGSVGRAASHGCVRMYNRDINELFTVVAMGTPVIVEQ